MTYRLRNIAVAVGLALIAALLTTFYVANYKRHVQQSESTVKVWVAKKDIPQGTPGVDLVKQGYVGTADVAQHTVVPGAIQSPAQVSSLLTTQDIYAGEQITLRRFANDTELGVRSQLHGTLRALSIPGTSDQLLAGTLRDGDHVDFMANLKNGTCDTCFAVRDIVRNILVLSAPQGSGSHVSTTSPYSVLLAVSERNEAQKIFYAMENAAGWTLELRPVANATDSPEDVESGVSVLKDNVSAGALRHFAGGNK